VDYISAVSGGGYIAAWLVNWIQKRSFKQVVDGLRSPSGTLSPRQIQWLRQYSSYLTPRVGLFGSDFSLFLTTYIHNLLRNAVVLLLLSVVVLMIPRAMLSSLLWLGTSSPLGVQTAGVLGGACALLSILLVIYRMLMSEQGRKDQRIPGAFAYSTMPLLLVASIYTVRTGSLIGSWLTGTVAVTILFWHRTLTGLAAAGIVLGLFFSAIDYFELLPYWSLSLVTAVMVALIVIRSWDSNSTSLLNRRRFIVSTALTSAYLLFVWIFFSLAPDYTVRTTYSYTALLHWFFSLGQVWQYAVVTPAIGVTVILLYYAIIPFITDDQETLPQRIQRRMSNWQPWTQTLISAFEVVILTSYILYRSGALINAIHQLIKSVGLESAFSITFLLIVPSCVILGNLSFNILTGLCSRAINSYKRERVSAVASLLYIYTLALAYFTIIAIFGPLLIYRGNRAVQLAFWAAWAIALGLSVMRWNTARIRNRALAQCGAVLQRTLPYFVFTGLLILIAYGISAVFFRVEWNGISDYLSQAFGSYNLAMWPALAVAIILAGALASGFGTNLSSMHLFYQARLAWAYLGERLPGAPKDIPMESPSMWESTENEVTTLSQLRSPDSEDKKGPYLILNATLNLAGGQELAWQERKASSFIFTPQYCGFDPTMAPHGQIDVVDVNKLPRNGFAPSAEYGSGDGISLAMALAISGSALSSNMGQHTSARVRFLHALLNLRLGWWLVNPRFSERWKQRQTGSNLNMLLSEIMGRTNDRGAYVYVSDGGHFENLGIYELVRRRCRVIVVSDCSEDGQWDFGALGNAIERCRADFGYEIKLDISKLIPTGRGYADENWTVGSIDYGNTPDQIGYIVYLKAVATKKMPLDVWSYGRRNLQFPNHPTANQWFTESQFESYRSMGEHVASSLCESLAQHAAKGDLFRMIEEVWITQTQKA